MCEAKGLGSVAMRFRCDSRSESGIGDQRVEFPSRLLHCREAIRWRSGADREAMGYLSGGRSQRRIGRPQLRWEYPLCMLATSGCWEAEGLVPSRDVARKLVELGGLTPRGELATAVCQMRSCILPVAICAPRCRAQARKLHKQLKEEPR